MTSTPAGGASAPPTVPRPYYEALDKAHDDLLRCSDCGTLVTYQTLFGASHGFTPCCGTKRVREIRTLTVWEWLKIRTGWIDFPHRDLFLKEFARGR